MPFSPQDWLTAAEIEQRELVFRLHTVQTGTSAFGKANWLLTIIVPHPLFGSVVYGVPFPLEALAHARAVAWEQWYRLRILPLPEQGLQMPQLVPLAQEEADQAQQRLDAVPSASHLYPTRHYIVGQTTDVGLPALLQVQQGSEPWQHVVSVNGIAVEDVTEPEARATIGTPCCYQFKVRDENPECAEVVVQGLVSMAQNWPH